MQLQVTNSPFNQEQIELLNRLVPTLTENQRMWLSGYLAALQGAAPQTAPGVSPLQASSGQAARPKEVTVLFGSQTGNSQGLAKKLSRQLEERGYPVHLSSMSDYKPGNLKKAGCLLMLVSTHGEGDPPDNALTFYDFLHSKRAPRLEGLRYSVLALGDTSYEFFCKTGKDFDQRLEELGGERLCPRVDCDVDFDDAAAQWFEQVLNALGGFSQAPAKSTVIMPAEAPGTAGQPGYSRTFPFEAEVVENMNLNGRGSARETRHLAISLEGSNLQYEPGDCLGVYPENHPELVDALIEAMGWNSGELVPVNKEGDKRPVREALLRHFEITVLTRPLLEQVSQLSPGSGLRELLEPGREQELKAYMHGRDLVDLAQDFSPLGIPAGPFVEILRKIPARLYSIASSLKAYPDEAHLTIRAVRYEAHGRDRYGVCSVQCAERIQPGDKLRVYVHQNPNFKLPPASDIPILMIGPGTGVAPFRAFLQEREETGAEGKTWLFFGDQHFRTDFLYQIEWQKWLREGVLTRMDVAFSRDTDRKVYVQHRMLEKSRELYQWLEEGAYLYVCGDEKHMAHDVHATLMAIVEREGGKSPEEAAAYLTEMQQQRRYQRDVY
ncbi:assimilatory sulfite reductase (NADPH) flavoprotein subunit [Cohnella pontilimi]|uniref:assimilatory sulfite reductase (NADPH) n=1 Tax=Cohnella pontilimi TaxID=2564100 RepID=A0A4U0FGA8_9BACL|nr:assimilatory sulfite reductase (NADPH) flavoprotein subunit [Cohnella pontilimi]TJY44036.1 assimilatory sulfite reductase (NADPH) flavoprotein subunit [Cohnella pontilimi]